MDSTWPVLSLPSASIGDDFVKKQFGINKNKQVSFADLSKRAARESKETPNDPISKAGLQASLNILQ